MSVSESIKSHFLCVLAEAMPTEPGLYWAQTSLADEFDTIVEVYGKPPWLKYQVFRMKSLGIRGRKVRPGLRIGPRIERPCLEGK